MGFWRRQRPSKLLVDALDANGTSVFHRIAIELLRDRTQRIFLVSSVSRREGKSTAATNLAVVFSRGGHRTLLALGDRRNLSAFGKEAQIPEIGEVVARGDLLRAQEGAPNLFLLKAMRLDDDLSLYDEKKIARFLEEARVGFDYIFIDSPSIGEHPFPVIWCRHVDGVLLVMRLESARRGVARRAKDRVEAAGGKLTGVVLNQYASPLPHVLSERLGLPDD